MLQSWFGNIEQTNRNRVPALTRIDVDLHRCRKCSELILHVLCDASEHRGAAREREIAVEIVADIDIALGGRLVRCLVHACALHAQQQTLETSHHCSKKR